MRTTISIAAAIVLWSGAVLAQGQQIAWTWDGSCLSTDNWQPTTVTKSGKQGPKGYLRYENLGYVFFCFPA